MANGKTAKNNERVIVNRDFSILIPQGYNYSLDTSEINDNRVLVFIKTERNEYYDKEFGDYDAFDLDAPFGAPQCCTIVPLKSFGVQLDLSDSNIRDAMRNTFQPIVSMVGGTCTTVKESNDILVYYSKFNGKEKYTHFLFATRENIYNGQIWLNDISTQKERERIAKEWLNSIENYVLTDADKIPSKPFVVPTYNEKKREQMGTLTVAVPDQMKTLVSESKKERHDFIAIENLKKEFAFLAINNEFKCAFNLYSDAEFIIKAANDGIKPMPNLANLWGEEKKTERKKVLTDLVKNGLQGSTYKFVFEDLANELSVVYTQVGESTDNIEQWANFFVIFFHKDAIIQVNIHIKAVLDVPAMEKAVASWVASAKPASKDEIDDYNKVKNARALGPFVGKNGKIDGVKASQMFFEDIFFFVKGQIIAKGRHHALNGLQVNGEVIDDYSLIKSNISVYVSELVNLLNFVEEDELLILDKECVHYEFDNLNKIDPPIINGVCVEVNDAKIGKGLSGIRAFLFIAWHMAKIVESEENKYAVALDQNMYRGIPEATAYVCQLIKRLREYNGINEAFEVVFASTFNCCGAIDGAISGRNPLHSVQSGFEPIRVEANENPYEKVQKKIADAQKQGVWQEWQRGKNAKDYDDLDEELTLAPFDSEENYDLDAMPEVDEQGRIAPTTVKPSHAVIDSINAIGGCDFKPVIKGKVFVLTEVTYPDIIENYIIKNGGVVKSSTVLTTDYLIIGDEGFGNTVKVRRAIELNQTRGKNIKAMTENDFWRMMADDYKETKQPKVTSPKFESESTSIQTSAPNTHPSGESILENKKIETNTAAIKEILNKVSSLQRSANKEFEHASDEVEKIASGQNYIFGEDDFSRNKRAIETALTASNKLYTSCQELVLSLDEACRQLIVDGMSYDLIREISGLIVSLNSDSDIENNFSGFLNGMSLGELGTLNFKPTDKAKAIESYWKSKAFDFKKNNGSSTNFEKNNIEVMDASKHKTYETAKSLFDKATTSQSMRSVKKMFLSLKGYLDSEKYVKKCDAAITKLAEAEAAQKIRKADEKARLAEEKQQKEIDAKEHAEKIVAGCNAMVEDFKSKLNLELKLYMEEFKKELSLTIEKLESEKLQLKKYLSSLGFFRIFEKKSTNDKISEITTKLLRIQSPDLLANEKKNAKKIVDHALKDYKAQVDDYVNKRFPGLTPKLSKDNNLQVNVLKALSKDVGKTVSQIMSSTNIRSSSEINSLIKKMYPKGYLERAEVDGVVRFYITEAGQRKLEHPQKADGKISYRESEKYAALPYPNPPQIDNLFPIIKI